MIAHNSERCAKGLLSPRRHIVRRRDDPTAIEACDAPEIQYRINIHVDSIETWEYGGEVCKTARVTLQNDALRRGSHLLNCAF